jgi:drug/metabolite transporter (DMT)-like permease
MPAARSINPSAFVTLLVLAAMFGGNHVAARFAFDAGVDVATAVAVRSLVTAVVVALVALLARAAWHANRRQRGMLLGVGLLVALQSLCLYSAVARLPVALALLAFNTFPLMTALWSRAVYGQRVPAQVLWAMPVLLLGLALALDVSGAASQLGAAAQWQRIGAGVAFALAAAGTFGLALAVTQNEIASIDGRWRTVSTMGIVSVVAVAVLAAQGGPHWPHAASGWWGLAALTVLYGTAFTVMFTLLPKLGVVGSSPILNVEPVCALALAWWLLDQRIAPVQIVGAVIVVAAVMWLGLRKA